MCLGGKPQLPHNGRRILCITSRAAAFNSDPARSPQPDRSAPNPLRERQPPMRFPLAFARRSNFRRLVWDSSDCLCFFPPPHVCVRWGVLILRLSNLFEGYDIIITNRNDGLSGGKVVTEQNHLLSLWLLFCFGLDCKTSPHLYINNNRDKKKIDVLLFFTCCCLSAPMQHGGLVKTNYFLHRFSIFFLRTRTSKMHFSSCHPLVPISKSEQLRRLASLSDSHESGPRYLHFLRHV